ncbi:uncharacterized protein LOC144123103 isoform X2 [Amblyomma americanum]
MSARTRDLHQKMLRGCYSGLNNDQVKEMAKCMGERFDSELKGKAKDIIERQGDNLAELIKKPCDADVDFGEVLKKVFSEEEVEAIKKAYTECKPGES